MVQETYNAEALRPAVVAGAISLAQRAEAAYQEAARLVTEAEEACTAALSLLTWDQRTAALESAAQAEEQHDGQSLDLTAARLDAMRTVFENLNR